MAVEVSNKTVADEELARMLKALGDVTRLRLFLCLLQNETVAVGEEGDCTTAAGPTMGEVCCKVTGSEQVSSTLSHHMKELRTAGLIDVCRQGRNMICCVRPEALRALESLSDACRGAAGRCSA